MSDNSTYTTPQWFWDAVDIKPEQGSIEVGECEITYFYWSEPGSPGLLFVHGHNAHAHWWDFITPSYKDEYQTVALDLSGMGDSDHRDEYSADLYAEEIVAVADKCEMPGNTILVSHSFGGAMSIRTVARNPDRFKGLILLDSGIKHPDDVRPPEPERLAKAKLYPSAEVAQSRFRLQPPQQCENQYIVDHIARSSVEYIDDGFGWKFDEEQSLRMQPYEDIEADFKSIGCKCALIYGDSSEFFTAKSAAYMKELLPHLEVTELADAQHHLFLDQPLTFMEALTGQLNAWS
ncbi:MAG: alpha/beta hydrolase [Gammaproteobacteria bacterium]|jgi:pimeloyl-ACP methyl ester carboxylesterase|nr:alpha/beta hydrolase [Gammaproteobacteria bacterium]MBT4491637.1 alpha/beta hydrolase [Gammaproteobacteria bacterium]MBT7370513.1 alpha/beta hydrolase [Gammaproteobacteria bacterium]